MASKEFLATQTMHLEKGHAEYLIPLIEKVIASSGLSFPDLQKIAVTVGPGSFTGLRVGISAAKSMALALKIPVVGVSTLSALAAPHMGSQNILAAIDARHNNYFAQMFSNDGKTLLKAGRYAVEELVQASLKKKIFLTGTNLQHLTQGHEKVFSNIEQVVASDIEWVARLGALALPEFSPAHPIYLKGVDALKISERTKA